MRVLSNHRILAATLLLFFAAIIFINPVRETAIDDDWAYAQTVQHLMTTGDYRLDQWVSANMPAQAYWGDLFAQVFGYSFATLRVSTLVLAFFGLLACYGLARSCGLSNSAAGLLTLVLLVSPVLFRLSFTFMTDVPFLALLLMALYAYAQALRQHNIYWAVAGSLAAAATILIRQFGVVLPLAWGVCWLLDSKRWKRIKFYGAGLILPAASTLWQVYMGAISPNWSARYTLQAQRNFLMQPIPALIGESLWRILVTGLYLALFVAPLALPALWMVVQRSRNRALRARTLLGLGASALVVLVTVFLTSRRPESSFLMPYLPWNLGLLSAYGRLALTGVALVAAILLWPLLLEPIRRFRGAALPERLIDLTAFFALLTLLGFYKIGDEYLLILIPFALLAVGKAVQDSLVRLRPLLIGVGIGGVIVLSLWMRWQLAYFEAEWRAADTVHQAGVAANQIATEWTWSSYNGAFDAYVASQSGKPLTAASEDNYFNVWLPQWLDPQYVVTRDLSQTPGEVVYQGSSDERVFEAQPIYVVKKPTASP